MTIQQVSNAEQLEHVVETDRALRLGREPAAEDEILPDREMRKEPALLEHVADAPAMLRDEYPAFGIDQRPVVEHDAAAVGAKTRR